MEKGKTMADRDKLERLELLEKAMEHLGRFGRLFVDYKGCPRGPRGELGDVPGGKHILLNEDPIVDVEGDTWIPVYAKDLYRYIDKHRWIPVTERLPEKQGTYLCRYGFSHFPDYLITGCIDWIAFDKFPHWQHASTGLFVTHWMPLPEAPHGQT